MVIGILYDIFHDLKETNKILLDNEITKIHEFGKSAEIHPTLLYRCQKAGCQARSNITSSKLEMKKALHAIYLLLLDVDYKQLFLAHGLSSATISKIKKKFLQCCIIYMQKRPVFIGGLNIIVEADETVLSRRGIIREPTSTDDSTPGTLWIVGLIEHFFFFFVLGLDV
ncbi:hypothetical protein HZS_5421 [Henneguya salminicola]|nr:hypothetical protein HZS_5421 [Henneguya salminicola]